MSSIRYPLMGSGVIQVANEASLPASAANGQIFETLDTNQLFAWNSGSNDYVEIAGGGGGGVSDVTATAPLASSGGATPDISLTGVIPLANGGSNKALTAVAGGIIYSDADSMEVLAAGSAGQLLQSNGSSAPSWSSPSITNFKNRIINGAMEVDQRNNGAAQTFTAAAALAYSVDRWYGYCTGANVTGQRVAGSAQSQYRYQFTGAASVTAIGFGQRIEDLNSYDLNDGTVTLSVDLANSLLTSVGWSLVYANTANTFGTLASPTVTSIASGTFTVNSTVTRYSVQISVPSAATTGLELRLTVGAQTSGTWTIGNVQLEAGSLATNFSRRPYGQELLLCQRYLPAYRSTSTNSATNWIGFGATTTAATGTFKFPVQARAPATGLTVSAASHFTLSRPSTGNVVATSASFAVAGVDNAQVEFGTASGLVADIGYYCYMNNASGYILFNGCEL